MKEIPIMLAYLTVVVCKEWARWPDYLEMRRRLRRFWRKKEMFLLEFLTWYEINWENSTSVINNELHWITWSFMNKMKVKSMTWIQPLRKQHVCNKQWVALNNVINLEIFVFQWRYVTLIWFAPSCEYLCSSCTSQEVFKPKTRFFSALGTLKIL